jgi:hypothetical protein
LASALLSQMIKVQHAREASGRHSGGGQEKAARSGGKEQRAGAVTAFKRR